LATLVLGSALTLGGGQAIAQNDFATAGRWLAPFEEDPANAAFPIAADTGGTYQPADQSRPISSEHCYAGQPGKNVAGQPLVCKPSGVSVTVLPDGRVLYWDGLSGFENIQHATALEAGAVSTNSQARILDLRGETARFSAPTPPDGGAADPNPNGVYVNGVQGPGVGSDKAAQGDMFCSDLVLMADGRLAVAGGTAWYEQPQVPGTGYGVAELEGLRNTRIFDPATNHFIQAGNMNYGRWYPDLVELGNGDLFVAGGVRRLITTDGTNVRNTEVFHTTPGSPEYLTWTDNGPSGQAAMPLFPRLHLLPDGTVYYGGVGQMWGPAGESADQALYNLHTDYSPKTNSWSTYGLGTFGARSGAFSVLQPLKAPYTSATVLVGGGTLGAPPGSYLANNFSETASFSFTGDLSGQAAPPSFAQGPTLQSRRWYSSAVILPNDTIGVFNGGDKDEVVSPGSESAVRMAEWYTPWDKQFHNLSPASRDRTYHNTAVLLPDGSVLVGGHAPIPSGYGNHSNQTQGASQGMTANNFRDPSFEIYQPPYLFKPDRPEISRVQSGIAWGSRFRVNTGNADDVSSVRLIRLPALTHIVDANLRSVELPIVGRGRNSVEVAAPPSGTIAPPGYYYLFINRGTGADTVPSTAAIVKVSSTSNSAPALLPFGNGDVNLAAPARVGSAGTSNLGSASSSRAAAPAAGTAGTARGSVAAHPAGDIRPQQMAPALLPLGLGLGALALARSRLRRRQRGSPPT
jgi:hypothetical protein